MLLKHSHICIGINIRQYIFFTVHVSTRDIFSNRILELHNLECLHDIFCMNYLYFPPHFMLIKPILVNSLYNGITGQRCGIIALCYIEATWLHHIRPNLHLMTHPIVQIHIHLPCLTLIETRTVLLIECKWRGRFSLRMVPLVTRDI